MKWFAVTLIAGALLIPARFVKGKQVEAFNFVLVPALLLLIVKVIDHWNLVNSLCPLEFFVLDKAILFPVVALTLILSGRYQLGWTAPSKLRNSSWFWICALGLTWALASYTYGVDRRLNFKRWG